MSSAPSLVRSHDALGEEHRVEILSVAHRATDTDGEIATRRFVSPATVEYHLRKVFGKFAVCSDLEVTAT